MSSSSDLLVALQPPGSVGRRASILADRVVGRPHLLDLANLPAASSVPEEPTLADVLESQSGAGHDAGYEAGLAEGRAAAAAEAEAERVALLHARVAAEQLVVALGAAVEEARRQRAVAVDSIETQLAEAAFELASAVLGREAVTGAEALARGLALVPRRVDVVARLHPDDLATIDPDVQPGVTLQPDASVERGGCVLDLPDASIDAQLGPALERARAALLDETEVAW